MISGDIVPRREESGDVSETQHCHCVPLGSSWAAVGDGGGGQESFGASLTILGRNVTKVVSVGIFVRPLPPPKVWVTFVLGRRTKCGHLEVKTFHLVALILSL